jgi:hypothetical protein
MTTPHNRHSVAHKPAPSDRPHWYRIYITECPQCGRSHEDRIRVHGTKPDDPAERYVHIEHWDGCGI